MSAPACKTCPFWGCDSADRSDASERPCRVRPPATWMASHRESAQERDARWPYTRADDWCGEHPLLQRDRLAALAMQGCESASQETEFQEPMSAEDVAKRAYAIADAMLKARGEEPSHG